MGMIRKEHRGVPFCAFSGWDGVAHGFSTRLGGISPAPWDSLNLGVNRGDDPARVRENYRRFCAAIGADVNSIVKNHQIHSDTIHAVTRADIVPDPAQPAKLEGDGLITNVPGLCLTVFSADCIPILFYDPVKRVVAAVHAGWRGTAKGIAARAVERMVTDYGCQAASIQAAIGPGISRCCFETHADVPQGLEARMGPAARPFLHPIPGKEGKFFVDLKGANRRWLLDAGLLPEHIAVSDACTACGQHEFWSHRLLGSQRGSMAAMIALTPLCQRS